MVNEFLDKNPNSVVINMACGLNMRCYRMDSKYKMWYNLDLPETIEIRSRFVKETDKIKMISKSAFDSSWAADIEPFDGKVLIIIEGLTMYLDEDENKEIFEIINERFKEVTVFVEIMHPSTAKRLKEKSIEASQAKFIWGVENGAALNAIVPKFKNVKDVSLMEGMKQISMLYKFAGLFSFPEIYGNKIAVMQKEN